MQGAIDLSGKCAALALLDDQGNTLLDETVPMRGHDSAKLADWVITLLAGHRLAPETVRRWTVGSGPGSFTGMRLAASLVAGWHYVHPQIACRSVPSAVSLAAAIHARPGEKIGALFDGRNREFLVFGLDGVTPSGYDTVADAGRAADAIAPFDRLVALGDDFDALAKLLPETIFRRVERLERFSALPLIESALPFDNDLTRLVYIRPAVFS